MHAGSVLIAASEAGFRRYKGRRGLQQLLEAVRRPVRAEDRSGAPSTERQQLVADLHDGALQLLAGSLATLRLAERLVAGTEGHAAAQPLRDGIHLVEAAVGEIRSVLFTPASGARPAPALAACLQRVMRRFEPLTPTTVHLGPLPDLAGVPAVEQALAGIVGEALANAIKHANARNVWVEISVRGGVVTALVRDDGVGFDIIAVRSQPPGQLTLGLTLIEERARLAGGLATVSSRPGEGTVVEARLPVAV